MAVAQMTESEGAGWLKGRRDCCTQCIAIPELAAANPTRPLSALPPPDAARAGAAAGEPADVVVALAARPQGAARLQPRRDQRVGRGVYEAHGG